MLQNFLVCVNAVVPSAIFLTIGIILRLAHVVTDEDVKRFTHMVFVALYPFIMFDNIYGKDFGEMMDIRAIVYAVGFTTFQIIVSWVIVLRIEKKTENKGVLIQALFRSNIVLMGLPVGINLLGRSNVVMVALVILFVVPYYNVMSVVVLEHFRGGKGDIRRTLKKVVMNPIIIGGIVAGLFMLLGIELPSSVQSAVTNLSDCTAPIALILLGASLNITGFKSDKRRILICTIGKLVIYPALGIAGAAMLGMTGPAILAIALMTMAPVALASYAMASSMGGNGELAGELVVVTTLASCFTMPVILFIMKTAGLF